MIPEIGQLALALALTLAIAQAWLGLAGAARGDGVWMRAARPAARGQFVFVAIAFGCLTYAFVANDFTVIRRCRSTTAFPACGAGTRARSSCGS